MTTFGDLTCVLGTRLGEEKSFPGKLVGGAGMAVTTFGHMYAVDKENACVVILKAPSKPAPKGSRSITSSLEDDSGSIVSAVTELHDERSSASRRLSTITESTVLSHSRGNLDQRPGKAILIRTPEVSRKLGSRKGHTLSSESKKSSRRRSSDRIEELTLATGSESSSGEEDTSVSIDNPRDRRLVNSVLDKVTSSPARREERSVSPKRSAGSKQRQRVEELSPSETEDSLTYSSSRAASTVGKVRNFLEISHLYP